jgi:tripartite-type tricarboxylate transporter receptor subunit TctC
MVWSSLAMRPRLCTTGSPHVRAGMLAGLMFVLGALQAHAQSPEEFYKGRTVTLIIGSGSGQSYDTYGRMLAGYLAKHIPGQPHILVQNMPGAGGIKAANYLGALAVRDGSLISDTYSTMPLYPLFDGQGATFDPLKLNWLGSIASELSACIAWHTTNFRTLDDAIAREMRLSASGIGGWRVIAPGMLNLLVGSKFRVISGYAPSEVYLAIERGEVDGACTTYDTLQAVRFDWLSQKKVRFVAQFGEQPEPGLEGATMVRDRIADLVDRKAFALIMSQQRYGRPFAAPPGVPPDRVRALREAFDASMRDPDFLAEARQAHIWVEPLTGEQMERLIGTAYASPPDVIQRAKSILAQAQRSK